MEYWKQLQNQETIADLEFRNRMQQDKLEQALKTAEALSSTEWLHDGIAKYKKREAELNEIINDWKHSYYALITLTKEYSNRLSIDRSEFVRELNANISEPKSKSINTSNPILLKKYLNELFSEKEIYDLGEIDFIEWKDISAFWITLANQGNADAQFNLGWFYKDISEDKSLDWFAKSAKSGNQKALQELEIIRDKQSMDESNEAANEVIALTKNGSFQQALELIMSSQKKGFKWAKNLIPYLTLSYENKIYKSISYNGKDLKGIKIKNHIEYFEIDLKNNSDYELFIKQPGSPHSGVLRQKRLPGLIKIPPRTSVRVEIWPEEPSEVSSRGEFIDPEWFYPKLNKNEHPFQIPSNLKLDNFQHRIYK